MPLPVAGTRPGGGMTKKEYDQKVYAEYAEEAIANGAPHYPKWLHHADGRSIMVKTPDEHAEQCPEADGWCGNPGEAQQWAKDQEQAETAPDPEDAPNPEDPYYGFNQPQVLEAVKVAKQTLQVELLQSMLTKELAHPKKTIAGGRPKVIKGIEDALGELERLRTSG